jgi:rod shape-determining protein MreC
MWSVVLIGLCGIVLLTGSGRPSAMRLWLFDVGQLTNRVGIAMASAWDTVWQTEDTARIATLEAAVRKAEAALIVATEWRQERDQLRTLVGMSTAQDDVLAARVIRHRLEDPFHIVVINRGTRHGVTRGMVAVADGALVGRVEEVAAHHATVLLLTDPNHAVDVVSQQSRTRGVLRGRAHHDPHVRLTAGAHLTFLQPGGAPLAMGEPLVTSGLDGRFPPQLPVGRITRVESNAIGGVDYAVVTPLCDPHRIEVIGLLPATPFATPPSTIAHSRDQVPGQ